MAVWAAGMGVGSGGFWLGTGGDVGTWPKAVPLGNGLPFILPLHAFTLSVLLVSISKSMSKVETNPLGTLWVRLCWDGNADASPIPSLIRANR